MMRSTILGILLMTSVALAAGTDAPTSQPAGATSRPTTMPVEVAAVQAMLLKYADAMRSGDAATMLQCSNAGTGDEAELVAVMCRRNAAVHRAWTLAVKRFEREGAIQVFGGRAGFDPDRNAQAILNFVPRGIVVYGDRAVLIMGKESRHLRLLCVDGQWKIEFGVGTLKPEQRKEILEIEKKATAALDELATGLESGQLTTVAEAAKVVQTAYPKPTSQPATAPAR